MCSYRQYLKIYSILFLGVFSTIFLHSADALPHMISFWIAPKPEKPQEIAADYSIGLKSETKKFLNGLPQELFENQYTPFSASYKHAYEISKEKESVHITIHGQDCQQKAKIVIPQSRYLNSGHAREQFAINDMYFIGMIKNPLTLFIRHHEDKTIKYIPLAEAYAKYAAAKGIEEKGFIHIHPIKPLALYCAKDQIEIFNLETLVIVDRQLIDDKKYYFNHCCYGIGFLHDRIAYQFGGEKLKCYVKNLDDFSVHKIKCPSALKAQVIGINPSCTIAAWISHDCSKIFAHDLVTNSLIAETKRDPGTFNKTIVTDDIIFSPSKYHGYHTCWLFRENIVRYAKIEDDAKKTVLSRTKKLIFDSHDALEIKKNEQSQ